MKKQSVRRLEQMRGQFPIIHSLENQFIKRHGVPETTWIHVQRADPSLMFRELDNTDGKRSFCTRDDNERGTRSEFFVLVDENHQRLPFRTGDEITIRDRFSRTYGGQVKYIVWVTNYNWYKPASIEQERLGEYLGELVEVERIYTVYLQPKGKYTCFGELLLCASLNSNVELSERMLISGLLRHNEEYETASEKLGQLAQHFENEVYLKGMKDLVEKSSKRGMGGVFNGIKLMSWVMCGRIMVTLEVPNQKNPKLTDTFTIIGNEPPAEAKFGWRSIYATMDQANKMIKMVIAGWSATENKVTAFKDDPQVKLDVLA